MANTKQTKAPAEATVPVEPARPTTNAQISVQDRTARQALLTKLKAEEQKEVTISPMYAPYFGEVMMVIINGLMVTVPCDGRKYKIPASFAAEVYARIRAVDDIQRKGKQMENFQNNNENYIGERPIV